MQTGLVDQEPFSHTVVASKFWCSNPLLHVIRILRPCWYQSDALGEKTALGISGGKQALSSMGCFQQVREVCAGEDAHSRAQ